MDPSTAGDPTGARPDAATPDPVTTTPDTDALVIAGDPVTVTDGIAADFAAAVGAAAPDGGAGLPVTLAAALTAPVQRAVMTHPTLRIDLARTLHTAQASRHHRPIVVGDRLTAVATVTSVRAARGGRMISFDTVLTDADGLPVQTLTTTLLTGEER